MKTSVLCVLVLAIVGSVVALENGLGRVPAMGWNSWNKFNCNINEKLIQETAVQIQRLGLDLVGYKYINLDDCWQADRDPQTHEIIPDKNFPSGIKALADYMHSRNLKFGLYSSAGLKTCAGRPASLGFEEIDANTYAKWDVDYLKYDNCYDNGTKPEVRYPPMRDALLASGRPILYSMCEWGVDNPASWAKPVGNSWRTTGDISDNYKSMLGNIEQNDASWEVAAPGGFNDPDMLEVGNGGMTHDEYITHFSLWCLAKSPLLIGCDVTKITNDTLSILTNTEAIAINQDSLGAQGHKVWASAAHDQSPVSSASNQEVWAGPLANGDVAVVLLNTTPKPASVTAQWTDIGLTATAAATVRDLWAHENRGSFTGSFTATVPAHGAVFVRVIPKAAAAADANKHHAKLIHKLKKHH